MKLYAFTRIFASETGASMHLALQDEKGLLPLNNGFGVLFPKADFSENDFVGECKGMEMPWVAPWGKGYVVLSLRRNFAKGQAVPETGKTHCVLLFSTENFCEYEELALLPLAPEGCVIEDIRAVRLDDKLRLFALYDGQWHAFDTSDLHTFVPVDAADVPARAEIAFPDATPACEVEISDALADVLKNRLTPAKLPEDAVRYPFPLMKERGDPMAIRWKDGYLFAATDDERGQRRLLLRWAKTLSEIPAAADHAIFHSPDEGDYSGCIWAPELHWVGDRLCIFFAAGMPHWYTVQSRVIWLEGEDPLNPAHWSAPRRMETPTGDRLTHTGITLDMTVIHAVNGDYVVWSQRVMEVEDTVRCGTADLMIARLNTQEPWRLASEPVLLSRPEYGWERIHTEVLEGPFLLRRGNTLHLTYAAALIDHTYAVGMLTARDGDDLLSPASWRKCNYPLVHRLSMPDQLGGGHNAFVKDEHGNDVLLIHALSKANYLHDPSDGRRFPCFRQVVWDKFDFPHLDAQ